METVQLIMLIGMAIVLLIVILSTVFAYLGYRTMKDPKTYIIEGDEGFAEKLYEDFASRLVHDEKFAKKAKEVLANSYT